MLNKNVEILQRIRAKVSKYWIKGSYARDVRGNSVASGADSACKWCLVGAVASECSEESIATRHALTHAINKIIGTGWSIEAWNDAKGRTKEEVLDVIDKVILAAQQEVVPPC